MARTRDLKRIYYGTPLKEADAHRKADRGTQMHKVLELVLLDMPERLLSDQQRADADLPRRTLDRYKLTPHDGLAEAWPYHRIGDGSTRSWKNRTAV